MPGWLSAVLGAAEIAGGVALAFVPGGQAVSASLIGMGIGTEIGALGTLLSKGPLAGGSTSERNPVAAREVVYGRVATGGTPIYINQFGTNNKYVDMIFDLADFSPSRYVTGLMLDRQVVQIDTTAVPSGVPASTYPQINGGMSFTPLQQDSAINGSGSKSPRIASIQRTGGIVTCVTMNNGSSGGDIPLLIPGSFVVISQVPEDSNPAHDIYQTINGRYQCQTVSAHTGSSVTFTYVCGGVDSGAIVNAGYVSTQWPNYGSRVYMEVLTGNQALGTTFVGMLNGTPNPSDPHGGAAITYANQGYGGANGGPWTAYCSGVGCTLVFLRFNYDSTQMPFLPQISFLLSGKNNIKNWNTSPTADGLAAGATGYTENWALCVADFMCDPIAGYGMTVGVDISLADLQIAATVSDEAVALAAGGTEPRYLCNGRFPLTMRRGEILKNMLTAGAGRIRESANGWVIQAGAWPGSPTAAPGMANMMPHEWSPVPTITEVYNMVAGTYIWPGNNWQSSDFPPYAQDTTHGYGSGAYSDQLMIADGGQRRRLDIQLPFTISPSCAQRIAKIELMRRRQFWTGVLRYNLFAYQFTALDIITETVPYLSFSAKVFEVSKFRFTPDPKGFITELSVQETDSSVYDWSATEELTPAGYAQVAVPSALNPSIPTGLTLLSDSTTEFIEVSGKSHSRILVSWVPPTDGYVLSGGHIEAQYELVGASFWTSLPSVDPSSTQLYISDVVDGDQYDVQIRSVNAAGVPSAWVGAGPVTASSSLAGAGVFAPTGGNQYPVYQDALFSQAMFGLTPTSETLADAILAGAQITPLVNPNVFSTLIATPLLSPVITYASTGGFIPGGASGFIAIALLDSAGAFTALSDIVAFSVPTGTNTNTLTLTPTYDVATTSILIYTGTTPESLSYRFSASPSGTITLTTLLSSTGDAYPIPDSQFVNFVAGVTKVLLIGSFGGTAATISSIEAKTSLGGTSWQLALSGAAFTVHALMGRILSWISQGIGNPTPIQNYTIVDNDATTVTVSAPTATGYSTPALDIGDEVYIPLKADATIWASSGGTIVKDALLTMTAGQYKGSVCRVLYSDGTNQTSFITTNDAVSVTVDAVNNFTGPVPILWWIESGSFSAMIPSKPKSTSSFNASDKLGLSFFVPFDNTAALYAVQVFAQDAFANLSPAPESPIRLLWWPGAAASVADSAPPPQPAFTADASIPGSIHFSAINFAGATLNLETVSTLQFGVYYEVPLHSGVTPMSLTVDIGTGDTSLTISHDTTDITGSFILIDAEVIALTARTSFTDVGGVPKGTYNCTRGIRGSTAAAHTATTTITILACQTLFYQFVSGFWNPGLGVAWQTWQATEALPNTLIAFIDLVAINALGVSPLDTNNYLPGGLATGTAAMTATDPISYGAAANGTTDDSVPISSAIAAGGLFLQPGRTYAYTWAGISAAMATIVDGFTITGGGILKLLSGSTPALTFAGSVVVRIIGVTIDGNSATGTQPLILLNSGSKICLYIVMAIGQGSNPTVGLSGGSTALSYNASGCVGIPDNTGAF